MGPISLQDNLKALQQLVAFAEGDTNTFPALLLKIGDGGLITADSDSLKQVIALSLRQIEILQAELRHYLRQAAVGSAHMIAPQRISIRIVRSESTPRGKGRRRVPGVQASMLISGTPRDVLFDQTNRVLPAVALEALKVCPSCGKAFVKVTRKRFCSTRCQSKIYMRQRRAKEREEREAFLHGKAKRARRRIN